MEFGPTDHGQKCGNEVDTMVRMRDGLRVILATAIVMLLGFSLGVENGWAQRGQVCDSCESCSKLLESNDARVELSGDIVHSGDGPCIVIKGDNAVVEGMERDIRSIAGEGTVGIRVEGTRPLVRNVHLIGADVGMDVVGAAETTLFHVWVEALSVGVRVGDTSGFRLTRSVISGGTIGVSFGAQADGTCREATTMRSPASVILGNTIFGTQVGIAACDAAPVVRGNRIFKNGTGIRLNVPQVGERKEGAGATGPFDECICKPELSDVRSGSALFYSSGCHGCQVHEAWLPDLRKAGHDIRLRASGPENTAASREFDVFVDRCLPQLTDVVGVPGCVPNYSCLTTDVTHKVRQGEEGMMREVEINSPEQLGAFAEECKRVAERSYRTDGDCVIHQMQDNIVCNNTVRDIVAGSGQDRWAGVGNACGQVDGYRDVGAAGCEKPCGDAVVEPTMPPARERKDTPRPQNPAPAPAVAAPASVPSETVVAAPSAPAEAAPTVPTETAVSTDVSNAKAEAGPSVEKDNRLIYLGAAILVMLIVVALLLARRRPGN